MAPYLPGPTVDHGTPDPDPDDRPETARSHYDPKRQFQAALFATNCLGCGTEEGGRHKQVCPFNEPAGGEHALKPIKVLKIDVRKLIGQYGLIPRYATMDRDGTLMIMGPSKENA